MPRVQYDFRSDLFGSSAKRIGFVGTYFGESEVSELEIAVKGDQQVLGLQVPVNHVLSVHLLEHGGDLRCLKLALGLLKLAYTSQVRKHLTPANKF
jgi:hypothetical protein